MSEQAAVKLFRRAYELLITIGNALQPIILLAFRLYWGWKFYRAGLGKLQNHQHTAEFFTSLGIPMADLNAWFVGGVECVGGLLLLVGLLSRPTAFVLAVNMLVAYISVEADRAALLNVFTDPKPFIAAAPFFFLLTSLLVLAFGPGKVSLDCLLQSRIFQKYNEETAR